MKRILLFSIFVLFSLLSWNVFSETVQEAEMLFQKNQYSKSLKMVDSLMNKALSLQVKNLAKQNELKKAQEVYEYYVRLNQKESVDLLNTITWGYLQELLQAKNDKAISFLAHHLSKAILPQTLPWLQKALKSTTLLTQTVLLRAISHQKESSAIQTLLPYLKDSNHLLKTSAAYSLAILGEKKGNQFLLRCFQKSKGVKKLRCAHSLAQLKDKAGLSYLHKELKNNRSPRALQVLVSALSHLGSSKWIPRILSDLKSNNQTTQLYALEILGKHKVRSAKKSILALLKTGTPSVKIAAARTLGLLKSNAGEKILLELLSSSKETIRQQAAEAAGKIKTKELQIALLKALQDPHLVVRLFAGFSLVQHGKQEGLVGLREAILFGNPPIQAKAVEFLLRTQSYSSRLKGSPLHRQIGSLPSASMTKAFVDADMDLEDTSKETKSKKQKTKNKKQKATVDEDDL